VLLWNSIAIYLLPCIGVYIGRAYWGFLGRFYKMLGCYYYTDRSFQGSKAIGLTAATNDVDWVRANELSVVMEGQRMQLFEGKIEPADLCQGHLGDCWLVAAMASLAEHPGAVRNCFLTTEYSDRGKYMIRLWDGRADKWEIITVDDYIPVKKGTKQAIYMRPNGRELWAVILEKAFAKFCGSYHNLNGGCTAWALHAMTGNYVLRLAKSAEARWTRKNMYFLGGDVCGKGRRSIAFEPARERELDEEGFFDVLLQYSHKRSVMSASIDAKDAISEKHADDGLIASHAYSILQVRRAGTTLGMGRGIRLLQLRNPWKDTEWNGAWSDGSDEWEKHPGVARWVGYESAEDGVFWMEHADFVRRFSRVDICDRTTKNDLRLDINEDEGCLGPLYGCARGCGSFWCCCMGARTIYCGNQTSRETETGAGCCITA
jgi:hypothetical protein